MSIHSLLSQLIERLAPGSETAALDAQVLLGHVLGRPRSWLLAHPEAKLNEQQQAEVERLARRLEEGEPLPYVIGHWEFFGLEFTLFPPFPLREGGRGVGSPPVLIPRPETELLVERAVAWLKENPGRRRACDVGTGSGCIAVSLAVSIPDLHVLATDISSPALQVARRNVEAHRVDGRVELIQADLFPPGAVRFDLICANLPYIPTDTLSQLAVARFEPRLALDGGEDGLAVIRRFLRQAPRRLAAEGLALLEIEASQGEAARALAQEAFPGAAVAIFPDLAGRERVVEVGFERS